MADRIPLILNTNANQIQEMPSGDTLDLTGSNINGVGILTCSEISARITGDVDIQAGIITATTIDCNGDLDVDGHINFDNLSIAGVSTFSDTVRVGTGVTIESNGQATFVGIVTFGSGSTTVNNNVVNVGTALTLGHTQGVQFHTQNLHSNGFEVNQVNASGIVTATTGVRVNADGSTSANYISVGASNDFKIYHTGSHTHLDNDTGHITATASQINLNNAANSQNMAQFIDGGFVRLYYAGNLKLSTETGGVNITGICTATTFSGSGASLTNLNGSNIASGTVPTARLGSGTANNTTFLRGDSTFATVTTVGGATGADFNDNVKVRLGTGNDLEIYHNGSHSYISNVGTGELVIEAKSGENGAVFRTDGAAELYYDNSKRIETSNTGVTVTGVQTINSGANDTPLQVNTTSTNGPHMRFQKDGNSLHFVGSAPGCGAGGDLNDMAIRFEDRLFFNRDGTNVAHFNDNGHFVPATNNTYDLGLSSHRWRNLYTNDLHLSNEGSSNDVDNTWGDFTIQEGESDLFLINNRSGKKYKFNLTEVS